MPNGAKTVLDEIAEARRARLWELRAQTPLAQVREAAERRHERRNFSGALAPEGVPRTLAGRGVRVIAELKRASPSRGVLREDYRSRELAQGYEAAGAAALSVLTEEKFFRGSLTDLIDARDAVGIPVLRKDFILDDYQVYESVAAGADALLLIVALLPDEDLRRLVQLCDGLEIAALVEVHTEPELERALRAGGRVIGVNNRDLKTFEVDLETSLRLREKIPSGCLAVSESGIKSGQDLRRLADAGYHAVLIGEQLMTMPDPGQELARLLEEARAATRPAQPR